MHEQIIKMKSWWSGLALREKQSLLLGGMVLSVFILYACLLSPLWTSVSDLREQISSDQETLGWMQAANKEIQAAARKNAGHTQVLTPVVLLSVLQKQINHAGLDQYLTQLKQANNESIEVQFKKVSFDKLASLLITLLREQPVSLERFSIVAENESGVVNAEIMIKI